MKKSIHKKLINKKVKKLQEKKCKFCENDEYCTLQVHRIIPGCEGGKYIDLNTVVVCSNCHTKIHNDIIKIDRKYPSTKGWILHYYDEKGEEHWD